MGRALNQAKVVLAYSGGSTPSGHPQNGLQETYPRQGSPYLTSEYRPRGGGASAGAARRPERLGPQGNLSRRIFRRGVVRDFVFPMFRAN